MRHYNCGRRSVCIMLQALGSACLILGVTHAGVASDRAAKKIDDAAVHSQVSLLRLELEYIRSYMGRPRENRQQIRVQDAAPREVFFQAITLFRKADRLCFELNYTRGMEPAAPAADIQPRDVLRAVNASLQRLRQVKQKLGIEKRFAQPAVDSSIEPSDVFSSIVQANRQLNLMLEKRFSPSDVFQQVTVAIAYSERLMEQHPGTDSTVPAESTFEPNKMPSDVYRRLLISFAMVRSITKNSGVASLQIEPPSEADLAQLSPSDVYDVASLVVSELAYLHSRLPQARPPQRVVYPGRKFPSHVYQRVAVLEKQLKRLDTLVQSRPEWLDAARR